MNRKHECWVIGIMCFLLTIGIFIQVNTVTKTQTSVARTTTESELKDSISKFEEKYNNSYKELEKSNKKLEELMEIASPGNESMPKEIDKINDLLGYTSLKGKGLIITVEDGNKSTVKGSIANYLVHDKDLINIVNLLKYAGAEAISINDERIVNTTAITCAGNIIIINGKKVGTPFVIKSIGLTEKLYGTVKVTNSYLRNMESQGVQVTIEKSENVEVPEYTGIYNFNYAKSID